MKRLLIAWIDAEDDVLRHHYNMANGCMTTYQAIADELNERFHSGVPVRKVGAVSRRDGFVNYAKPWGGKRSHRQSHSLAFISTDCA